jgi:hypothetical protein
MKIKEPYQPIGRKLLWAKNIGESTPANIRRDIACISYVIPKKGSVPDMLAVEEYLMIPTFEIATNPLSKIRDDISKDRLEECGRQSIQIQEDREILKAIDLAVMDSHIITCTEKEVKKAFNIGVALIEEHLLTVDKVVCHPYRRAAFSKRVKSYNKKNPDNQLDLLVSVVCPRNTAYFLAAKEYVGRMPIRKDITVLDADDVKAMRAGVLIFEEIGIGVAQDYAISKIKIVD